ncbi:hypothetical protein [Methylobacterium frigidaeris]|uniref:hypothetical protein n=1 Tax=Methylobacterium frigidaeris TaxID=2038277 RepID=UPI001055C706|nr:hypothetical protein [Methylobacterium frigidaeris]
MPTADSIDALSDKSKGFVDEARRSGAATTPGLPAGCPVPHHPAQAVGVDEAARHGHLGVEVTS